MTCTFHDLHWEKEISLKGYFLPDNLNDALQILSRSRGKARVVAGGTDVIPQLRRKELEADYLVDLSRIAGLDSIQLEDGFFSLGAMLTHSRVCASEPLREKAGLFVEGAEALGIAAGQEPLYGRRQPGQRPARSGHLSAASRLKRHREDPVAETGERSGSPDRILPGPGPNRDRPVPGNPDGNSFSRLERKPGGMLTCGSANGRPYPSPFSPWPRW